MGIGIHGKPGARVTQLDLSYNNQLAALPREIGNLTAKLPVFAMIQLLPNAPG